MFVCLALSLRVCVCVGARLIDYVSLSFYLSVIDGREGVSVCVFVSDRFVFESENVLCVVFLCSNYPLNVALRGFLSFSVIDWVV